MRSPAPSWIDTRALTLLVLLMGSTPSYAAGGLAPGRQTPSAQARASAPRAHPSALDKIPWVGFGGGAEPDSNQLSIEQDLLLAVKTLGTPLAMLYAGGPGSRAVQVLNTSSQAMDLKTRLGALFSPRAGRAAHYQRTVLDAQGTADPEALARLLKKPLPAPFGRAKIITLYVAGHGKRGDTPAQASVPLWAGGSLKVPEVAKLASTLPGGRGLRLVMTSCYSGGFADFIFKKGEPGREGTQGRGRVGLAAAVSKSNAARVPSLAKGLRCGLFATTWDRQASGCDPDPDRSRHEGYGPWFLHALKGEDRQGRVLPREQIDFDGDGKISLLEAHSLVRIASRSFDVPITSSERWLRLWAASRSRPGRKDKARPLPATLLKEERAVVAGLALALKLGPQAAARSLAAMKARLEQLEASQEKLRDRSDEAWWGLTGALLSRWPTLDDPYRADWAHLVQREALAIDQAISRAPAASRYLQAQEQEALGQDALDALLLKSAWVERLVRAQENLELAAVLYTRGGVAWKSFERLRACEAGLSP